VLSEPELVVMFSLLLVAGHETTVNLIGTARCAVRHRTSWRVCTASPS